MHLLTALFTLITAISPARTWYPPSGALTMDFKASGDASLVLTNFDGGVIPPAAATDFSGEKTADIKQFWPGIKTVGTYILYVQPKGKSLAEFEGTPLVIEVRSDRDRDGGPAEVVHVGPLEYALMTTNQGPMTMMFYYDVAPITVGSFLDLSRTGYYDKLTFHRIHPGFVIQGGDPVGNGSGGPGYHVPAEFNDRPHLEGVLSMARASAPSSGGSQFFVCLDYSSTKQLDHNYTVFGRVVAGMDTVKKIAATPIAGPDQSDGPPATPQVIEKVEVKPVTAAENPYADFFHLTSAK